MAVSLDIVVVSNRFGPIAASMQGIVNDALDNAVLALIETADPLTPVDTGALKGNKTIEATGESRTVTWNQDYAAYNEFGTVHMAPRPFARPGIDAAEPVLLEGLARIGR